MVETVYAIMDDGPLAGTVLELNVGARDIEVTVDDSGAHHYRRYSWGPVGNHIAHFRFTCTKAT